MPEASDEDVAQRVTEELVRLGAAACGMFNRGAQHLAEQELGRDLEALLPDDEPAAPAQIRRRCSSAASSSSTCRPRLHLLLAAGPEVEPCMRALLDELRHDRTLYGRLAVAAKREGLEDEFVLCAAARLRWDPEPLDEWSLYGLVERLPAGAPMPDTLDAIVALDPRRRRPTMLAVRHAIEHGMESWIEHVGFGLLMRIEKEHIQLFDAELARLQAISPERTRQLRARIDRDPAGAG